MAKRTKKRWKPTIACDFDGVLHDYDGKWAGPGVINGEPIRGALHFIGQVYSNGGYNFAICSTRSHSFRGRRAMKKWLRKHLEFYVGEPLAGWIMDWIKFPRGKPPATIYLDDRAWRFEGEFPTIREMLDFRPWNRKQVKKETTDA